MVRKYQLKIGGMPHARLERNFYLKVFRHHLFGQPPSRIVTYLNAPGPTVRRALNQLRLRMINCTKAGDYIYQMSESVKSQYGLLYEDVYLGTWSAYSGSNRLTLFEVDQCLRACPISLTPNQFKKRYLKYSAIVFDEYAFVIPHVDDQQEFSEYLNNALRCNFCKLKKLKDAYRGIFSALPHIYLDYMHYFSSRRVSNPSHNELLQLHLDATSISMLNEIYMKFYTDEYARSGSMDQAEAALLDFFLQTTEDIFSLIERLDIDELKFQ